MDDSGYLNNKFIISASSSSINQVVSPYREIKRLKKLLCYNGYYISFLLGMITEEEFKRISNRFIELGKK